MKKLYSLFTSFCGTVVNPLANLFARFYIGWIFFKSGRLKLEDFEGTIEFFEDDWALPFLSPEPAAYLATAGELILPVLLFLGLFTRIGAAGLLVMAAVIQFFVLPDHQHYLWMAILALILGQGGGKLSLDYWVLKERN